MGKNQTHKAMQRAKMSGGGSSGGPGEEENNDGMVDGSFHSPEWHAARLASLKTTHTITWEEFKKKQKEEARIKEELEGDEEKQMREYRAQLDAERASKLARGRNHADKEKKKGKKVKDERKSEKKSKKEKDRRRKRRDESESESSESEGSKIRRREKRKLKKEKVSKRRKHADTDSSSDSEDSGKGPVALSSFFSGGQEVDV